MSFIHVGATIGAMVLSVILGFVWYGPLFGKQWMVMTGLAMPSEKPAFSTMLKPMILSFIGSILLTFVLSSFIAFHNAYYAVSGIGSALGIAFLSWLGFIVPTYLNLKGWEGKPWKLFWINTGYWLVFLMIVAVLITVL